MTQFLSRENKIDSYYQIILEISQIKGKIIYQDITKLLKPLVCVFIVDLH